MQHETHNLNNLDKCEPQQQYRLGTVSYKYLWGFNRFYSYLTSPSASAVVNFIFFLALAIHFIIFLFILFYFFPYIFYQLSSRSFKEYLSAE